ncbi:uncharacterized protein LOC113234571 isoform X1 [Hyposmocoma kahamanoa]|uniref:uncharacterized protein LOC113234571 isoform X1 n=1 Tax=Hyposmocoma kahamanoa TaxID=1477025 RepID=UPI000E6D5AF5|nr:uncharacterized protein LOC113234571 isoform X1 [Hyposmocoma kahamanoa]
MKDINSRIKGVQLTRLLSMDHFAWQIGYVTFELQNKYRKIIDRYNSSLVMDRRYFLMEHILFLVEMEYAYWEIDHYALLLHEIEAKYKQNVSDWNTTYLDGTPTAEDYETPDPDIFTKTKPTPRTRPSTSDWTSTRSRERGRLGEYGWEPRVPI